jgi:Yersinia/Haemophilus virulence surface antigen
VGFHRLCEGLTAFFDPNLGVVGLRSNVFDEWVAFYWENSDYTYDQYRGKVFQSVGTWPSAGTPARATPAKERPKFSTVFKQFPGTH